MLKKITIISILFLTACPGGDQVYNLDGLTSGAGGDNFRPPPHHADDDGGSGGTGGTTSSGHNVGGSVGGNHAGGSEVGGSDVGGSNQGGSGDCGSSCTGSGGFDQLVCPEGLYACKQNCGQDFECKKWCWDNCVSFCDDD